MGGRFESRSPSRRSDARDRRRDSRSRSPAGHSRYSDDSVSRNQEPERPHDFGTDTMKITSEDAAFILGKGGKTKVKVAKVSNSEIELFERDLVIEVRGSLFQRKLAMKYLRAVIAQRTGVKSVDISKDDDGDLTVLRIPQAAVGFVTGRNGNFLRTLEDEWNVLMLFAEFDRGANRKVEELAIFGDRRGRRGAELKALSAVEAKCEGFFDENRDEILQRNKDDDWGVSTMEFNSDELAYALGKKGATRRKIEASSTCITQYIGRTAIFAGTAAERHRAKEYTKWLFDQLDGPVYVDGWEDRDDCTVIDIPQDCVGYVTGSRRAALGQMEDEFGVLMFFMGNKNESHKTEQLIIFGEARGRIGAELKVKSTVESKARRFFTKDLREKRSSKSGMQCDIVYLNDDEISYALGARGSTRKKLQRAAGCVMQYVGNWAHLAGEKQERKRAREYLNFLLEQRKGKVFVEWKKRSDALRVDVPSHAIGYVTGSRGNELRRVEEATGTFCFLAEDSCRKENMLVLGADEGNYHGEGRLGAERMILELVREKDRKDREGYRRRDDSRSRSPQRRRPHYDSRSRSPPRRRRYDSRRR